VEEGIKVWKVPRWRSFYKGTAYFSPVATCCPDDVLKTIERTKLSTFVLSYVVRKAKIFAVDDEYTMLIATWLDHFHDLWYSYHRYGNPNVMDWEYEIGDELLAELPEFHKQLRASNPGSWRWVFVKLLGYVEERLQKIEEVSHGHKMGT
jgi:hypothetical protein